MIGHLLRRLEQNPMAIFSDAELREIDDGNLEALKLSAVLRPLDIDLDRLSVVGPTGQLLDVADTGERVEAFDPDDPEFDPIAVNLGDYHRWQVDVERLARLLQRVNGCGGAIDQLSERLVLLGELLPRHVYALGLFTSAVQAWQRLHVLRGQISVRFDSITVGCPSVALPLSQFQDLRDQGILVVPVDGDGKFGTSEAYNAERPGGSRRPKSSAGRVAGRGLGSLLDCWVECHHLNATYLHISDFYAAVGRRLQTHPEAGITPPANERFPALKYNGAQLRIKTGKCAWHKHSFPPGVPI